MGWIDNDVALITGGGSGLGLALVRRFLEEGARVAVLEFSAANAEALRREFGSAVVVVTGDVRSLDDNRRAVRETVERFGRLDIFVGNAGILDLPALLVNMPADRLSDAFDDVMGVNVKGYILGAYASVPELRKTGGCMVFTASSASFTPGGAGIFYTASKHAVVGVVRELAFQLAPHIRVNAVAPGPMRTNMRGSATLGDDTQVHAPSDPAIAEMVKKAFPLPCIEPEDYTGMFVALASRTNAATTTGEIVNAADGMAIRGHMAVSGASAW